LQKEPIPLVLTIISIVAALNIITMLIILIVEKTSAIGILRTFGLTRKSIIKMFIFIAMRTGIIGAGIGITLSLVFYFLQKNFGIITLDPDIYFVNKLPMYMS